MNLVTILLTFMAHMLLTCASHLPPYQVHKRMNKIARANDIPDIGCKDGDVRCLAQEDNGFGGGVFKCTNGFWDLVQDCRLNERCVMTPAPHCTWASAHDGMQKKM